MSLVLPHAFGRYTLTQRIGEGGMAEVYLAQVTVAEGLSKRVVVKKIRKEFAESIEANSVHGSDSDENAKIEIDFFFKPEEIVG